MTLKHLKPPASVSPWSNEGILLYLLPLSVPGVTGVTRSEVTELFVFPLIGRYLCKQQAIRDAEEI